MIVQWSKELYADSPPEFSFDLLVNCLFNPAACLNILDLLILLGVVILELLPELVEGLAVHDHHRLKLLFTCSSTVQFVAAVVENFSLVLREPTEADISLLKLTCFRVLRRLLLQHLGTHGAAELLRLVPFELFVLVVATHDLDCPPEPFFIVPAALLCDFEDHPSNTLWVKLFRITHVGETSVVVVFDPAINFAIFEESRVKEWHLTTFYHLFLRIFRVRDQLAKKPKKVFVSATLHFDLSGSLSHEKRVFFQLLLPITLVI